MIYNDSQGRVKKNGGGGKTNYKRRTESGEGRGVCSTRALMSCGVVQ